MTLLNRQFVTIWDLPESQGFDRRPEFQWTDTPTRLLRNKPQQRNPSKDIGPHTIFLFFETGPSSRYCTYVLSLLPFTVREVRVKIQIDPPSLQPFEKRTVHWGKVETPGLSRMVLLRWEYNTELSSVSASHLLTRTNAWSVKWMFLCAEARNPTPHDEGLHPDYHSQVYVESPLQGSRVTYEEDVYSSTITIASLPRIPSVPH